MKNAPSQGPSAARVGAVLLAAGAASRMGRPKLLLPWGGNSILGHLLDRWHEAGAEEMAVVLAPHETSLQDELDRLEFPGARRIINPHPERGMFSSIQCAVAWPGWSPGLTHWAVALGDQPHLRLGTLRVLLDRASRFPSRILQPAFHGRARHPVLLSQHHFRALGQGRGRFATLKEFLLAHEAERILCHVDDPGLDFDIDTPEDYEEARRRFAG